MGARAWRCFCCTGSTRMAASSQPQAEALRDRFRIVRPDFRGHGDTPPTPSPDIPRLGADVAELIDHLGLTGVIGVGWSLGASVLWQLMSGPAASAFAGLVVIDMSPCVLAAPDWTLGLIDPAMREPPANETALERGRRIAEMIVGRGDRRPRRTGRSAGAAGSAVADPASVMALGASLYAQDFRATLPSIRVPTLVVHGGASRFYPAETSALHRAISGARTGRDLRAIGPCAASRGAGSLQRAARRLRGRALSGGAVRRRVSRAGPATRASWRGLR